MSLRSMPKPIISTRAVTPAPIARSSTTFIATYGHYRNRGHDLVDSNFFIDDILVKGFSVAVDFSSRQYVYQS